MVWLRSPLRTTTFGGEALTGTLTASVRIENGEPVTKSCQPGEKVSIDITAPKGDNVIFAATSNAAGRSPLAKTTACGWDRTTPRLSPL